MTVAHRQAAAPTAVARANRGQAGVLVIKLTRLNNHVVAINPDHIGWVETTPDTTLFLIGGEKIIVRESLEELITAVVDYRRLVRSGDASSIALGPLEGDPPRVASVPAMRRLSDIPGAARSRGGQ